MPQRSRPRALSVLATVVAGIAAPAVAAAQGISLAREATAASDRGVAVADAEIPGDASLHGAVTMDYAAEPLVLLTAGQVRDRVVTYDLWLRASLALALRHRFLLGVELPASLARGTDPPQVDSLVPRPGSEAEPGDLRVLGRVRVLGPADDGVRLTLAATAWLPTGARDSVSSDERLRGGASAIFGGTEERLSWAVEAGFRTRRATELAGVVPTRIGTVVFTGAAARFAIDARETIDVGGEVLAEGAVSNGARLFDPLSTRGLLLAAARYRPGGGPFVASAAAGPGLGHAPGTGEWRGVLRAAWSPPIEPPPPDHDHDAIPDASDACPRIYGIESIDPNMHGCPEPPRDTDADSIPDEFDACPLKPGVPTAARGTHGCPKPKDRDQDQILDLHDACPDAAGIASSDPKANGCPPPPEPPPPPPTATLVAQQIVISQQIRFDTGTAQLRQESDDVLAEVAKVLADNPELVRVEVQGHTDDTGTPELNRTLGAQRAEAVVAWLVAHGIDASRLSPRGYGADRPLEANTTEAGRDRNRRVEFHVMEPGEAPP